LTRETKESTSLWTPEEHEQRLGTGRERGIVTPQPKRVFEKVKEEGEQMIAKDVTKE